MTLRTKFLILGALSLVMMLVPTALFFNNVAQEVRFAQGEAAAKDAVIMLNAVVQTLQTHRGLSAGGRSAAMPRWPSAAPRCATGSPRTWSCSTANSSRWGRRAR